MLFLLLTWFRIAQGAKRCHDINCSGWYQFIPFYTIVLLFQKGKIDVNRYGVSPKIIIVDEVCRIISIRGNIAKVELANGKMIILQNMSLPKYARNGDLIQHTENGNYIVVDRGGNLVFRM